jgi:hypothetical protein
MHHDPLRSTPKRPFFACGQNFMVFSLQGPYPSHPTNPGRSPSWCRMYRKRQTQQCAPGTGEGWNGSRPARLTSSNIAPVLAWEMIHIVARWIPQRTLRVLGDNEYAGPSQPAPACQTPS